MFYLVDAQKDAAVLLVEEGLHQNRRHEERPRRRGDGKRGERDFVFECRQRIYDVSDEIQAIFSLTSLNGLCLDCIEYLVSKFRVGRRRDQRHKLDLSKGSRDSIPIDR